MKNIASDEAQAGDRVKATLKKPNGIIGTWVVGSLIIRNNSFFVRDDIYQKEVEVVPLSIEIVRKIGGKKDDKSHNDTNDTIGDSKR